MTSSLTLLVVIILNLIDINNATYSVDASKKSQTITISSRTLKEKEKPEVKTLVVRPGDIILLKGRDDTLTKEALIDVIEVKSVTANIGWSKPEVISHKSTKSTIAGKKDLANHLNTDKDGVTYNPPNGLEQVVGAWHVWIEKYKGGAQLFKSGHDVTKSNTKRGRCGPVGQVDNHIFPLFASAFCKDPSKPAGHPNNGQCVCSRKGKSCQKLTNKNDIVMAKCDKKHLECYVTACEKYFLISDDKKSCQAIPETEQDRETAYAKQEMLNIMMQDYDDIVADYEYDVAVEKAREERVMKKLEKEIRQIQRSKRVIERKYKH